MTVRAALAGLALLVLSATGLAQSSGDAIARGEYIVENVGMCGDCHTPRDSKGGLVAAQLLQGAPLGLQPVHPVPFATFAPAIAGGPRGWSYEQLVQFLETGERPGGKPLLPPMPAYRLSPEDAAAVATYLRSLK